MWKNIWDEAVKSAAAPERVTSFLRHLHDAEAIERLKTASAEQRRVISALVSGSQWAAELLLQQPHWLAALLDDDLTFGRKLQGLRRDVEGATASALQANSFAEALARIRELRQRQMLRIAARDLARLATLPQILIEISNVADVCLSAVCEICCVQLQDRFGVPMHQDADGAWHPTAFAVLGMGKLGGQELNYSSDVDVLFVYSEEGSVFRETPRKKKSPKPTLTNHQFCNRLAESFIAEVGRMTPEGMLFRIDLRLRPEGDSGPLSRSLAGYENYYAQWGQTWERMMLIKTRGVAGDSALAAEFLEMVQPFRYPRSISTGTLDEVAAMKTRIETEIVKSGELERNVKLGRGGIREIEFIAQSLQLLHGGRNPFLQGAQTLVALEKLVQYHYLTGDEVKKLTAAYVFLRDVEHRLQMEHNAQTHTIPTGGVARERLARLMGCKNWAAFSKLHQQHTRHVRAIYDKRLQGAAGETKRSLPDNFSELHQSAWKEILTQHKFRDASHALRLAKEFVEGPGFGHVSKRTSELGLQLLAKFFALCPNDASSGAKEGRHSTILSDPDRVLARLDTFVSAYGARATLYEMWVSNPSLFELLLLLFDRSEFLAEVAIRVPDLVEDLVLSGHLRRRKTAADVLEELQHGRNDADQSVWLRRYHRSELMRIGLRDILGGSDIEQNFAELTALADACLQYALEIVTRENRLRRPPFAIVGLGKLGGSELNYGSDLDIVFVAPPKTKDLPKLQKVAVQLMDLMSATTQEGTTFVTDARLRPDGEKGLLVNTLDAYEHYYRDRAMLWEIQALTRTRTVAGDAEVGKQFEVIAARFSNFSGTPPKIVAYTPDWKKEIARMRLRIEKERTPAGKNALAIKTGTGGLMDAEFIAQTLCLERGWREPNTMHALLRARDENALSRADAEQLIANYRELRRVEAILRRWSYEGETELPDDPAPQYRVAVRCGWRTAEEFLRAIAMWRQAIREVYAKVLPQG